MKRLPSLLDYVSGKGILILDEFSRIQEINDQLVNEEAEWFTSLLEEGQIVHELRYPIV